MGTQSPELEDKDKEQSETPIIENETVSKLLHHLGPQKSLGQDRTHPWILTELAGVLTKPQCIIF